LWITLSLTELSYLFLTKTDQSLAITFLFYKRNVSVLFELISLMSVIAYYLQMEPSTHTHNSNADG